METQFTDNHPLAIQARAIWRNLGPEYDIELIPPQELMLEGTRGFYVVDPLPPWDEDETNFHARVELSTEEVTLMVHNDFMMPLIIGKRSDTTRETFTIHDTESHHRDERTITGVLCVWQHNAFFEFRLPNDDEALKLCRMILHSAWEHRVLVQARLPLRYA